MKKITLMIESCKDCIYCERQRKYRCLYAAVLLNGEPVDIPNPKEIMGNCPLLDATPQDKIPAPIYYRVEKDGSLNIVIDVDA
ncbi:MAG: hypothetical protein IIY21_16590 [Clostridiales bacterium]|nr:hypothetical protein [Clostridiales bacterium]